MMRVHACVAYECVDFDNLKHELGVLCDIRSDWPQGYPDCAGSSQSPINLSSSTQLVVEVRTIVLRYFVL